MEEGTRVNEKMSWIWKKGFSVVKKVLAASFVLFSAPVFVPTLVVVSTIALISSLPYCIFLVSYACTEKLMRKLLPGTAFGGRCESCDHKMILLHNKIDHSDIYDQCIAQMAMSEPILFQNGEEGTYAIGYREDENMRKEVKSLLESIRDLEDRTNQSLNRGISEKSFEEEDKDQLIVPRDVKLKNVEARVKDLSGKKQVSVARHEGELKSTTTEASKGNDMENFLNKMKVLYSEEQIWAKIEAIRNVVGYNVTRSISYSEELKALYMFLGVELPTLEKDNQDIAKISERICFLMSVIGIK